MGNKRFEIFIQTKNTLVKNSQTVKKDGKNLKNLF